MHARQALCQLSHISSPWYAFGHVCVLCMGVQTSVCHGMHAEGRGQLRCQSLPSSLREGLLLNALLAGFKLWGIPEILFFFFTSLTIGTLRI